MFLSNWHMQWTSKGLWGTDSSAAMPASFVSASLSLGCSIPNPPLLQLHLGKQWKWPLSLPRKTKQNLDPDISLVQRLLL